MSESNEIWKLLGLENLIVRLDFGTSQTCSDEKSTFDEEVRIFKEIVGNIALESEKSNFNPEIGMNWYNLPMEMRYECVKRMDFETRTRLSATSKSEKSLVEAKKIQFHRLHIDFKDDTRKWKVTAVTKFGNSEYKTVVETLLDPDFGFISAILKNGEVKNFRLYAPEIEFYSLNRLLCLLKKFAPFRFERVSDFSDLSIVFFIQNCVNLKKIDHGGEWTMLPYKEMLDLPSIVTIDEFRLNHVSPKEATKFLPGLVQKWIDNDAKVGESVQFDVYMSGGDQLETPRLVDSFAEKFVDRIIEKTDKEVRVRMENPTTQILLRHIGPRKVWIDTFTFPTEITYECFSCKVIPIDMPKSEYGIGDEWIQALYEKGLKKDGKLEKAIEFNAEDQAVWEHIWS